MFNEAFAQVQLVPKSCVLAKICFSGQILLYFFSKSIKISQNLPSAAVIINWHVLGVHLS